MKTFYNIEEMKKFYNKETNLFCIDDSIELKFNLDCGWDINAYDIDAWDINARDIKANDIKACDINACNINAKNINAYDIDAYDINARDINAYDIDACDINATNINARNINYYAVCFAYFDIRCKSIKGRRENCREFVLDGNIIIEE